MQKKFSGDAAWFSTQSLEKSLNKSVWQYGMILNLTHKVHDLEVLPCAEAWALSAQVRETESLSFTISINLRLTPMAQMASWHGQCQCQKKYPCAHAVALMLTVAQRGAPVSVNSEAGVTRPTALDARAAELARLQAEAQLLQWLQKLDRVNAANTLTQNNLQQTNQNRPDFYVYLLNVCQDPLEQEDAYLQIQAMTSYQKLKGGWAKPKIMTSEHARGQPVYDQATPVDHEVLHLIESMSNPHKSQYYYRNNYVGQPEGRAGLIALERAASTGRLYLNDGQSGAAGEPVRWGEPQPLTWQWQETDSGWRLSAQLAHAQVQLYLNNPPLYLDAAQAVCGPVQTNGLSAAQLKVLLKAPAFQAQMLEKHQVELLQRLGSLPPPPMLKALVTLQDIAPTPWLHLSPSALAEMVRCGLIQAQLDFDYAGHRVAWDGQASNVMLEREGQRFWLQRDVAAELAAVARLEALGLRVIEKNIFGLSAEAKDKQRWLEWADGDFAVLRQAGFELVVAAALQHWISRADALQVQLEPEHCLGADDEESTTSPWFELSLGMEINGQRHNILPWLPELIATVADCPVDLVSGQVQLPTFVYLRAPDAQGFIRLPTEPLKPWLAALLELVGERTHDFSGEHLKLSRMDALRTGAALGQGAVWAGAQALRDMVHQLKSGAELPEVPMPASVQASLRRYQQQGVNWLQFLRQHGLSGILADDMGLGKTLQTLVHIQLEKDAGRLTQPALIIAPVSLMGNWRRETERFCPQLRCLVLHGKERHEVASRIGDYDVVIAPYSLLQRDRERWLEARWHLVVLDEAQNIKNASTQAAQVVSELNTRHRLCLSGTPMENHLGEIWSLFHFLMPGFLGSQKRFAELFRKPIEQQGNAERMAQLRARVTPFMLRRTKAVVADELPPKIETVMRVELSGAQADLYETIRLGMEKTVREALNAKGLAQSQITILDALLKLRQVCCDPHLLKLEAAKKVKTSAKLEHLMELLPEMLAEGRRVLLFSQFTSMLTLIEAELEKRHIRWVKLTGQSQQRDALIEQFTSGQVPLFLISLKAGGVGLNLPQADTVIHYDPWWNPAVENQATDRAHRIGQKQSVWVVKLVAQGTIEERILALQERKAALAQRMYSGAVGRSEPLFSEDDLAELLKPLSL